MKAASMAAEAGAGVALSIKTGVLGGLVLLMASILGAVIGFKVVPPAKGREIDDISTRLLCGLLSSCTLGTYAAYRYLAHDPAWLDFWVRVYLGHAEAFYLGLISAVAPFVLLAALPGFWVVAGFMHFAQRKAKSLGSGEGA